ncbi:MAG: 30S ribosomal protein S7 [Chitinivibrionales bacterium]|nr:30S ribosomal protein S7 [Chitinivibrionales bacterium]
MARRRRAQKRKMMGDPKFGSFLVTRFVNSIMTRGKKRLAESIFYNALDIVGEKTNQDAMSVFTKAVDNVKPVLEVKSRRVGGANYQVPIEVSPERRLSLAIRWIINYSKARSEKNMAERLANELMQAFRNEGGAVRKKIDTHKMAEANRAFAHFRW